MFKKVDLRKKYSEMEQEVIRFWKEDDTFKKSVAAREKDDAFVFYDGPPFITGVPHYGTLLSSIVKDVVPRYWTMKGRRVERRWGWDCHGLPAENLVEKKLGIKDKRDIPEIGVEKYIETCRCEMVQGGSVWEDTVERIGRWVEFKNAYKTMDREYMESVWWAFKELYGKGKIYEGEKVLMYCTRCATPISKAEVAMDNSYKVVTDPSVYVKFPLAGEEDTYLLAWTTTPWTLSANVALAVGEDVTYVKASRTDEAGKKENFILAKDIFEKKKDSLFAGEGEGAQVPLLQITGEMRGAELIGKRYEPLFGERGEEAHRVIGADFVTTEDGTGIVHIAPAFGEDDYAASQKEGLPVAHTVDENGLFREGKWAGQSIWEVNKEIAKTLFAEGTVLKIEYIQHEYPHCHRCGTKLMYRAHPSWFMDIGGQRAEMLALNENIRWFPAHFKEKRFRNVVETAPDWNLSRDRFWATPIPVWRGTKPDGTAVTKVVGSYAELRELSGMELEDYHLPYVDKITFMWEGAEMHRVEKVLDCWFESGSMPFAQFHYPFENREKFEANFPGDFISEYVGQVRAWFYYLHAISAGLFGKEAFKNVIVTGTIAGSDGKKMSKSLGNYTDPNILLEKYSADALRYLLVSSPLLDGEDFALIDKDVSDVQRKMGTLWNCYGFLVMYANADGWTPAGEEAPRSTNLLDRWILSKLHALIREVDKNMLSYDVPNATKPIMDFVDELSNWYIRRSRKRFWKSDDAADKEMAYRTLYHVLVELAKVIAPFTPFVAEEIYKNLTGKPSVHLADFPAADESLIEKEINQKMDDTRKIITEALQLRAKFGIKVRQPLSQLILTNYAMEEEYLEILKDEINVKEVVRGSGEEKKIELNTEISEELRLEGQAREIIRAVQEMRKEAGYGLEDRIHLGYEGADNIFERFQETISKEVLADTIVPGQLAESDIQKEIFLDEDKLTLTIKK